MALLSYSPALEKGATSTATLNKTELMGYTEVLALDAFWQDPLNIKTAIVTLKYTSGAGKISLQFDFQADPATASISIPTFVKDRLVIQSITLIDFMDDSVKVSPNLVAQEINLDLIPPSVTGSSVVSTVGATRTWQVNFSERVKWFKNEALGDPSISGQQMPVKVKVNGDVTGGKTDGTDLEGYGSGVTYNSTFSDSSVTSKQFSATVADDLYGLHTITPSIGDYTDLNQNDAVSYTDISSWSYDGGQDPLFTNNSQYVAHEVLICDSLNEKIKVYVTSTGIVSEWKAMPSGVRPQYIAKDPYGTFVYVTTLQPSTGKVALQKIHTGTLVMTEVIDLSSYNPTNPVVSEITAAKGVAVGPTHVYVSISHKILAISKSTGLVTSQLGSDTAGNSGDDNPLLSQLTNPRDLVYDEVRYGIPLLYWSGDVRTSSIGVVGGDFVQGVWGAVTGSVNGKKSVGICTSEEPGNEYYQVLTNFITLNGLGTSYSISREDIGQLPGGAFKAKPYFQAGNVDKVHSMVCDGTYFYATEYDSVSGMSRVSRISKVSPIGGVAYTLSTKIRVAGQSALSGDAVGNGISAAQFNKPMGICILSKWDNEAPLAGSLTVGTVTETSVQLNIGEATDDRTLQPQLQYKIYYNRHYFSIESYSAAESNAVVASDWAPYSPTITISGLVPERAYKFTLAVKDQTGRVSMYGQQIAETGSYNADYFGFTQNASSGSKLTGGFASDRIEMISLADGGILIMTTAISNYGGVSGRRHVLKLNKNGTVDSTFMTNAVDGNKFLINTGCAAAQQPDGKLLLTSNASSAFTTKFTEIARYNLDGTLDSSFVLADRWAGYFDVERRVRTIKVLSDGGIMIGGFFKNLFGVSGLNSIAKLNSDGTPDSAFNANLLNAITVVNSATTNADVFDIEEQDGKILVGGNFANYGGVSGRDRFVKLNSDGTVDTAFTANSSDGGKFSESNAGDVTGAAGVKKIIPAAGGKVFVGGDIHDYGATNYHHLIKLNSDGTLDTVFMSNAHDSGGITGAGYQPTPIVTQDIVDMCILPNGKLLIGGILVQSWVTYAGSYQAVRAVYRLGQDGIVDNSDVQWNKNMDSHFTSNFSYAYRLLAVPSANSSSSAVIMFGNWKDIFASKFRSPQSAYFASAAYETPAVPLSGSDFSAPEFDGRDGLVAVRTDGYRLL
jgi:uncharacterized delta-60 repeat protein